MASNRLYYIDNLRIFLISLVVLHHLSITYGAPGGWYFNEYQAGFPEIIPMAMFVATNQSFFMGMFFFISAFFVVPSLMRKGTALFLKERLIRLGIPLLIFYFLLNPLTIYIHNRFIEKADVSLLNYILSLNKTGFGPLWFVEALLIFTLFYMILNQFKYIIKLKFPKTISIVLFALLIGLTQFVIRIWLPVGWSMPFTNFQFPFFVQYIFLFAIGIVARQNNWLDSISAKTGRNWFLFAQFLILIVFPTLAYFGGVDKGTEAFSGGLTWQSLSYALWEQMLCVSLIIGLIGISKRKFNKQGDLAKKLSESAYGVFVFHAPVIVAISVVFYKWDFFPPLKFIVLAPAALLSCFLVAFLVKHLPVLKRIF